jgi:hypothetical protein
MHLKPKWGLGQPKKGQGSKLVQKRSGPALKAKRWKGYTVETGSDNVEITSEPEEEQGGTCDKQ